MEVSLFACQFRGSLSYISKHFPTVLWAWLRMRGVFLFTYHFCQNCWRLARHNCLKLLIISNIFVPPYYPCHSLAGFVDIFSKSKDKIGAHASKILKFLHRNRIPSSAIPFPILDGYNSISSMRAAVLQDFLDYLLQKEKGSSFWLDWQLTVLALILDRFNFMYRCALWREMSVWLYWWGKS